MNVQELHDRMAELIAGGHAQVEVKFAYNYGDYWRTSVAASIDQIGEGTVTYSDYHSMDKVLDDDRDNDEATRPHDGGRTVIILE
jgi:hypothetical protein